MRRVNPNYSLFQQNLDNAKDSVLFARAGEIIQIVSASSPSAKIDVVLNDPDAGSIPLRLGDVIQLPFERFWFSNDAQANQWVKILISPDKTDRFFFSDYITSFDGSPRIIGDVSVTATLSSPISPSKDVSKFVLVNSSASADPLYLGGSNLAPSGGFVGDIILPTERKVFSGVNTSFTIYARCLTGGTATMGVIEYD